MDSRFETSKKIILHFLWRKNYSKLFGEPLVKRGWSCLTRMFSLVSKALRLFRRATNST